MSKKLLSSKLFCFLSADMIKWLNVFNCQPSLLFLMKLDDFPIINQKE